MTDSSPFVLRVADVLRESTAQPFRSVGAAPMRIGAEMIAVQPGSEVTIDGYLTPLGTGVLVDADVQAELEGQCSRCLATLNDELDIHISAVFSDDPNFITNKDAEDDEGEAADNADDVGTITEDTVDITQAVIDEAVLSLPFNPTCENTMGTDCTESGSDVPAPDGISGEETRMDPRWAALAEKFGKDS